MDVDPPFEPIITGQCTPAASRHSSAFVVAIPGELVAIGTVGGVEAAVEISTDRDEQQRAEAVCGDVELRWAKEVSGFMVSDLHRFDPPHADGLVSHVRNLASGRLTMPSPSRRRGWVRCGLRRLSGLRIVVM